MPRSTVTPSDVARLGGPSPGLLFALATDYAVSRPWTIGSRELTFVGIGAPFAMPTQLFASPTVHVRFREGLG
jgi:hypothetical protein